MHGVNAPPSIWHSNVAVGTVDEKVNDAFALLTRPLGPESIDAVNSEVLTAQV